MKKICVFSDSHGYPDNMLRAMELEAPDMVIFLGDGESDLIAVKNRFPEAEYHSVRGNCDYRSAAPLRLLLTVEGVRIFAVHGHEYNVKLDRELTRLRYAALEQDAKVVLFGHTHRPFQDWSLGMEILNPGSVGYGPRPSYAVLTIEDGYARGELKNLQ